MITTCGYTVTGYPMRGILFLVRQYSVGAIVRAIASLHAETTAEDAVGRIDYV